MTERRKHGLQLIAAALLVAFIATYWLQVTTRSWSWASLLAVLTLVAALVGLGSFWRWRRRSLSVLLSLGAAASLLVWLVVLASARRGN